jgi:cyclophilin family peptidyl-prolyl cis-trans isomerase/HEAT repeat protein
MDFQALASRTQHALTILAVLSLVGFAPPASAQADADLATLRSNLTHADPKIRQQAVRDMGRLERANLIPALTRPLADANVNVRVEAANAIGQLARGEKGVSDAKSRLLQRAKVEQEPRAWGAVAATLGRLPYTTAEDVDQAEAAIARVLPSAASTAIQIDALLGATEGLESLARQSGKISKLKPATLNGLRAAAVLEGRAQDAEKLARIRRMATLALTAAGGATRPQLEAAIADGDAEVRRLAMVAARAEVEGREAVIAKGLADANFQVRYEALQTWGRTFQKTSCEVTLKALDDANPHVALLAIDQLGNGCPNPSAATERLRALAAQVSAARPGNWHRSAHAIVSLARLDKQQASTLLHAFVQNPIWQMRMYAAHAAGAMAAVDVLTQLAADAHHNVQEAAISQLVTLKRPEAASAGLAALASRDYQLVMTAARAVSSSTDAPAAVAALRAAHARIRGERRDTSRDALEAIREAAKQLGVTDLPAFEAGPLANPDIPAARVAELGRVRLRFTMQGRGTFDLRLIPAEAPVTADLIARLAADGYYKGLTFHRVVPNFVIQGGSPGANEYSGQGPFMRDEVGLLSHRRGTVGISTRGRHTGDAQLFINLVDLPRLDHTYTVFAEVISGMDVVDSILEGDVIENVDVITPQSN